MGSPPANWTAVHLMGFSDLRATSMSWTCSYEGSYTYPASFALAKQIGQFMLHLFVRSRFAIAEQESMSILCPSMTM